MDLWNYLSSSNKTIVMYGMGNGADKIISVCKKYGVVISDYFASDEFVRGQQFHGKTVLTFDSIVQKYGAENIIVLVAFASSIPDVMNKIHSISNICEMYIPDVPVKGDTLFCDEFEVNNSEEISQAYKLLGDERSQDIYQNILNFRRTGKLEYLISTQNFKDDVISQLLHFKSYNVAVDAGAYDGDTAYEMLSLNNRISRIYAFEPDRRNYRKLSVFAENNPRIVPINAAVWNENTTLEFDDSGNRNSGVTDISSVCKRKIEVKAVKIDDIITEKVDYIKYDVEGAEKEALEGSTGIIQKYKPDLMVSLYHRTEDLFKLIIQVKEICPEYKLYIRRYPYIPAWDLNLYATVK